MGITTFALLMRNKALLRAAESGGAEKTNGRTSVRPLGDIKIAMLLNEAHMPFDFFFLAFFFAMTLLLDF
jgi:hypothetical protein